MITNGEIRIADFVVLLGKDAKVPDTLNSPRSRWKESE